MHTRQCKAVGCRTQLGPQSIEDFCLPCAQKYPFTTSVMGLPERPVPERFEDRLSDNEQRNAHYYKDVTHLTKVDVYRILDLFEVNQPCLAHLVKKALCAGERGHKDYLQDLIDIRDSIDRAIEMEMEDQMIAQLKQDAI